MEGRPPTPSLLNPEVKVTTWASSVHCPRSQKRAGEVGAGWRWARPVAQGAEGKARAPPSHTPDPPETRPRCCRGDEPHNVAAFVPSPLGGRWRPAVHQHTLPLCVGSSSNTVTPLCAPLGTLLAVWVGVAPQKALERTHQNRRPANQAGFCQDGALLTFAPGRQPAPAACPVLPRRPVCIGKQEHHARLFSLVAGCLACFQFFKKLFPFPFFVIVVKYTQRPPDPL